MTRIYNRIKERELRKRLRSKLTETELILWTRLKDKKLHNVKFRRQYSIGPFVVDFYVTELKLAIELDGESHFVEGGPERDVERKQWIRQYGINFLRFTNDDIRKNLDVVINKISEAVVKFGRKTLDNLS
jgi:very-short-patch-repair endonuclease